MVAPQAKKVNFRFREPEALADFLHVERTRLATQAHFFRSFGSGCVASAANVRNRN
jgi:hypothetical protein